MSQGIKKVDNRRDLVAEQIKKAVQANKGKPIKIAPLMRAAGYSDSYSEQSTHLVKRKTFRELLAEKFNSQAVITEQAKLVNMSYSIKSFRIPAIKEPKMKQVEKKMREVFGKLGGQFLFWSGTAFGFTSFYVAFEDSKWKYYGLDQIHKLLGNYAAEKIKLEDDRQFRDKSIEELQELIKRGEKESGK